MLVIAMCTPSHDQGTTVEDFDRRRYASSLDYGERFARRERSSYLAIYERILADGRQWRVRDLSVQMKHGANGG